MIGRRKAPEVQPTVSVVAIVAELCRSHGYGGDETAQRMHAERVRRHAAELGIEVSAPDWLPSLTVDQAAAVLNSVVAEPDPLDAAIARDAAEREAYRLAPSMTPAEVVQMFGGENPGLRA